MHRRDILKMAALMAQPGWRPGLFDDQQNRTVIALTDLIIPATDTPGAKEALVNRYIDKILKDGPAADRNAFLEGLSWLDQECRRKHRARFLELETDTQVALLEKLDGDGDNPGSRFFRQAKRLTSSIYYATEIGFQELNKGGRVPSTFACSHGGHTA